MLHRPGVRRAVLALAMCWMISAGCSDPEPGRWQFEFACPELKLRAERVAATIASGSCSAPGPILYEHSFALSERGPAPAELGPGAYAFSGQALGTDAGVVGAGCTPVTLPEQRDVGVLRQREDSPVEREERKLAIDQRRCGRLDGRLGRHRGIKGAVRRSSRRTLLVWPAQVTGMLRRLRRRRPPATGTLPWRRDRARPDRRDARRARPAKARRGSAVPDPRRRSLRRRRGAA